MTLYWTAAVRRRTLVVAVVLLPALVVSCGGPAPKVVLSLVPVGAATSQALSADAGTVTLRLDALGDGGDSAAVRGDRIVVTGDRAVSTPTALTRPGRFSLRPVLCGAPPAGQRSTAAPRPLPACQPTYRTDATALDVVPSATAADGYTAATVPPDPAFAAYRSTPPADDDVRADALLPADPTGGAQQYQRFVVGPSPAGSWPMSSARATYDTSIDSWAVGFRLTPQAALRWDRLSDRSFHEYVAIDLDGEVLSAPLIEPTQGAWASFEGQGEIAPYLTRAAARAVAALLASGPLTVPLHVGS